MGTSNETTITAVLLLLIVLGVGTYVFFSVFSGDDASSDAAQLSQAKEGVFTDEDNHPISLDEYEGKVRVVNAWASWSPFSREELPALDRLAKNYQDKDVVVIAINRKETQAKAQAYLQTFESTPDIVYIFDSEDIFYESVGGFAMPETVIYDRNGNIAYHKRGPMKYSEMVHHLDEVLSETED